MRRRRLEQQHLTLFFDTLTGLHTADGGLDAWLLALFGSLTLDAHRGCPLATCLPAEIVLTRLHHEFPGARQPHESVLSGSIDDGQPGQSSQQGDTCQKQRQQKQRAPKATEHTHQPLPHQIANHTAGIQGQIHAPRYMQSRKSTATGERKHEATRSSGELVDVQPILQAAMTVQDPAHVAHQSRDQISQHTQQVEQHIGEPGADQTTPVGNPVDMATVGPSRVVAAVSPQRHEQKQGHCPHGDQHCLTRTLDTGTATDLIHCRYFSRCLLCSHK